MTELLYAVVGALLLLAGVVAWAAWEVRRVYVVVAPLATSDIARALGGLQV